MQEYLTYDSKRLKKLDLAPFGIYKSNFYIYLDNFNHPLLSGNKLRKLYGSIAYMKRNNLDTLVTVGGNYSNYLHALAYLPELVNIRVVAIVKGYEPMTYGYTLNHLKQKNIPLYFFNKEKINEELSNILDEMKNDYPNLFFIGEGGVNEYSHEGFESIMKDNFDDCNYICVPVGTSGTYRAIKNYASEKTSVIGYAAHNDFSLMEENISFDYCFGGFAKMTDELFAFIQKFKREYDIELDPIYTSKMIYGIIEDYKKEKFGLDDNVVAIHTGGLQGWHGMMERNKKFTLS
jgi:1-aminocyclopropane-1-carboxylate deaminase